MDNEGSSGFQPGRTSALDYFKKFNGTIGDNSSSSGGGGSESAHIGGHGGQTWWFIYGRQCGKQALAGPYKSQDEAKSAALQRFSGWSYRILGMPTRDRSRARRMLTHEVARGGSVADSLKRMQKEV